MIEDDGERETNKPDVQLPAVVPDEDSAPVKLEPPEKGTRLSEGSRDVVDAGLSAVPFVGGALSGLGRSVLPSKRDKNITQWRSDVTEAVNSTSERLRAQQKITETVRLEHEQLKSTISATAEQVEHLSQSVPTGIIEPDPLDPEFKIYRNLIEQSKFATAIGLLRARLQEADATGPLPPKSAARVTSLIATCEKGLGNDQEAARLFIEASEIDPENLKHRSNLVVAHLLQGDPEAAERCVNELLATEPNSALHWANWVYVRSAKGDLVDASEIPLELRRNKDVCVARMVTLRAAGDSRWYDEAKRALAMHPDSKTLCRAAAEGDLERLASLHFEGYASPQEFSDAKQQSGQAAEYLLELWKSHTLTELYGIAPDTTLLQNTIMGLRLEERLPEARALVDANVDTLFADPSARAAVAGLAIQLDDDELLDRALTDRFAGDAPIRLERALNRGEWKEALEVIELQTEDLDGKTQIPPEDIAKVSNVLLLPEAERNDAFQEALQEIKPDAHSYLVVCQLANRFGATEVGDKAFELALTQDLAGNRELRWRLASECIDRDQPEKAIGLLEGNVDTGMETRERRMLALAYASAGIPLASGVAFFNSVQRAGNAGEQTQRAGGHFHLNRRRPQDALPWFRRALNLDPNNARTQLALWQSFLRAGRERDAQNFLATIALESLEGELRDRMDLCQVLWRSGRRDALDYAYDIAARHQTDAGVCNSYVGLFLVEMMVDGDAPLIPESSIVEEGSFVRLSRLDNGKPFEFVVVASEDDVALHLRADHPIVEAAMGKAVGEEFKTETGPNRFVWKIEQVKSKYLHLFHFLSHTLQDRFPDETALWSVTIKDDDVTPILENLKARRAQVERIETLYRDNPLPLASVASMGGGNSIEFAVYLAQSGQEMFSATGRTPDIRLEIEHARQAVEKGVVIDTHTGWLLSKLGLLGSVREAFHTVYASASCVDELGEMVENLKSHEDGRLTAVAEGDKIVSIQQSAEDLAAQVDDLRNVAANIKNDCNVVGIEVSDSLDLKLRELSDFLGTQFDTLSVAQREGTTVLSADLRLRQIAQDVFKIDAFGFDALLSLLLDEGIIDEVARAEALLTLAALRHSFIGLNAPTLITMMRIDDTDDMGRFQRASEYIGRPDANIRKHIQTAAAFALLAFEDPRARRRAEKATGMILRSLVRFKGVPLKDIVNAFARLANNSEVTSYVVSWLRGHFLMDLYQAQMEETDKSNADS